MSVTPSTLPNLVRKVKVTPENGFVEEIFFSTKKKGKKSETQIQAKSDRLGPFGQKGMKAHT